MDEARRATAADADELVRLRAVLPAHMSGRDPAGDDWRRAAADMFSVATDPDQRRRGYSRQCVTALLDWYRDQGIMAVFLRASEEGEPLYRSLGFTRTPDPAMRLRLPQA
ncbi:GNAT family N-acetyltransferase [Nonomuraea sp. NPDC049714]|uniref:GNAT family N-acetyltransferase n=1 Tax=Nonomuraea sp. NPDC049714 TaxID=3364357 RepID=UPI0037AD5479